MGWRGLGQARLKRGGRRVDIVLGTRGPNGEENGKRRKATRASELCFVAEHCAAPTASQRRPETHTHTHTHTLS